MIIRYSEVAVKNNANERAMTVLSNENSINTILIGIMSTEQQS